DMHKGIVHPEETRLTVGGDECSLDGKGARPAHRVDKSRLPIPSGSVYYAGSQCFEHGGFARMFAVAVFSQSLTRCVEEYFGLVVLPVKVHDGFMLVRPAVRPETFTGLDPVCNSILYLQVSKQGSGN